MSGKDAYAVLITSLGYSDSVRLRRIMEKLMTPEQAQMVAALPATVGEVAQKTGIDLKQVKDSLEELFITGVVTPRKDFRKRESFRFVKTVGQLHDLTQATIERDVVKDRELFELWYDFVMHEMYPKTAERIRKQPSPRSRVVPAYKSIKDIPGILACENFPELLKAQSTIAVVPCSCRYCTASIGKPCSVHDEVAYNTCLQFGRSAEYVLERGSGKNLSVKEALELSDIIEDSGLLHKWPNNSAMTGATMSCQCCRDCCMNYVPADQAGLSINLAWAKSRYEAYVNVNECTGCQVCVDRCLFDAITMERVEGSKKLKASVDSEKCFGCGVCVVKCKPAALKMKVVRPPEHIPAPPALIV